MAFLPEAVQVEARIVGNSADPKVREKLVGAVDLLPGIGKGIVERGSLIALAEDPDIGSLVNKVDRQLVESTQWPVWTSKDIETVGTGDIDKETADGLRNRLLQLGDVSEGDILKFASQNRDSLLPSNLRSLVHDFSEGTTEFGALHLKRFNIDGVGASTALTLAALIGEPYIESKESDHYVQTVRPSESAAKLQTNASYDEPLLTHTENAGYREPTGIVLLCERNEERAETVIVSPHKALLAMRQRGLFDEEALLWTGNFWKRPPISFGVQELVPGHQILTGNVERPNAHADFADVGALDPETEKAYKIFQEECERQAQTVVLEKGEVLLLRNTGPDASSPTAVQVMHGRLRFVPKPSASRLLYRVYVT